MILDISSRYKLDPNSTSGDFSVQMDRRFTNVIAARVMSAIVPNSYDNITEGCRLITIEFTTAPGGPSPYEIPIGSYDYIDLLTAIQAYYVAEGHAGFTATIDLATERVTFADLAAIQGHFTLNNSDERLIDMLGFRFGTTPGGASITGTKKFDGYGKVNALYLTSPQLFNKEMFSTNSPIMSRGVIAKIPVDWASSASTDRTNFAPSESQMYNFHYDPPIQFDYLHFTFFADKTETNGADDGYFIIEFNGAFVSITLELVILI